MPELPEVEVVRRGLDEHVVGRTIAAVQVFHPRAIRRHVAGEADFIEGLLAAKVTSTRRRGKYMWLALDHTDALVVHLGMSGQVLIVPGAEVRSRHERVSFAFADGDPAVSFVDQRTFGGLLLARGGAELPSMIAHIARDPFDPDFDDDAFVAAVRRRKVGLKRALLDQTLVSGIGNIYADEALWLAKLHWAKPTETMRRSQILDVLTAARSVMGSALAQGGTSFDSLYVNVNGQSGYFDRSLEAYGRRDKPCRRCGSPIRRESFMNRSSYSCPVCQPRPRRARC